jgi:hypothetical protein
VFPEPFHPIAGGDEVWLDLNPEPTPAAPSDGR